MAFSYNYGYGRRPPTGSSMRRFDEYYRCYPVIMMNGPDRTAHNFGGKVFMPPSALQKLTTLHIAYPMIFELYNRDKMTHAGVLEFVAEEGRIYLPHWMMQTLGVDVGDIIQVKSTDLPPGSLIKLKVEFSAPVGYKEPERTSGTSTPASSVGRPKGGPMRFQGTMAQSINYSSISPGSNEAAAGARAVSSNFLTAGHTLKKGSKAPTPKPSTPVAGASTNPSHPPLAKKINGPQPLRLPEGKLFFGYDVKPLKRNDDQEEELGQSERKLVFQGQGQTLRAKKKTPGGTGSGVSSDAEGKKR